MLTEVAFIRLVEVGCGFAEGDEMGVLAVDEAVG
jgi:hypothetical protein